MIIRPATLADLEAIIDIAMEQTLKYPRMRAERRKVKELVIDAISAARHYALVVESGNRVQGALLGLTTNNAWAQRQNCAVLLWYSWIPGSGAAMLRKFRDWVKSRRAIKVAGFSPDVDLDPRIWKLVDRIGFKRHGGAYLLYN